MTKAKQVIGLVGWAGSGKNEAAKVLADILAKRRILSTHLAFADPIREVAYFIGWDGKKDKAGRELLQDLGMAGRRYDKDVWLNRVKRRFADQVRPVAIITDVRFENEADWVFSTGILIRIERDGVDQLDHPSEMELDGYLCSICVQNNGSLDELRDALERGLNSIGFWE